jgi:hypothetical protein
MAARSPRTPEALLLGQADRTIRLNDRFTARFTDARTAELVEHEVGTLVLQRVVGIALGYEDLNDHDELRHDPVLAGKLAAKRTARRWRASRNRLKLSRAEATRYHKVSHHPAAIETLLRRTRSAARAWFRSCRRHRRGAARPRFC